GGIEGGGMGGTAGGGIGGGMGGGTGTPQAVCTPAADKSGGLNAGVIGWDGRRSQLRDSDDGGDARF
ncbi:MAG: hypothetical protein ACK40L_19640, partial [Hydrogenophaga sp.]